MQKHTPGMFFTDFHMQKYTGGIISWVGIFLTVTLANLIDLCVKPNVDSMPERDDYESYTKPFNRI